MEELCVGLNVSIRLAFKGGEVGMKREYIVPIEHIGEIAPGNKEIIRCKECKYWRQNTEFCGRWSVGNVAQHTPPDWFCADGERREGCE